MIHSVSKINRDLTEQVICEILSEYDPEFMESEDNFSNAES